MKLHFTKEWLKNAIENEPDGMTVEAGGKAMTETPLPAWAIEKAMSLPDYRGSDARIISVARALAAVEAETAERVERETLDRCAGAMRHDDYCCPEFAEQSTTAIRSIPAKYGKEQ